MPERGEWLTEAQAAEWLGVTLKDVQEALRAGDLPGLRIGGQVRLSRSGLLAGAGVGSYPPGGGQPPVTPPVALTRANVERGACLPTPAGFEWLERLETGQSFAHRWPADAGSTNIEEYPKAWAGRIRLRGVEMAVLVGEATGAKRGDGKPRLTVLLQGYPFAEFAHTADGQGWASLIKPDGRHTVAPGIPLPALYDEARVEPYHEATGSGGRGRSSGVALVIEDGDIQSAVYHAAARSLAKEGHAVEPAGSTV